MQVKNTKAKGILGKDINRNLSRQIGEIEVWTLANTQRDFDNFNTNTLKTLSKYIEKIEC
jgi:hypothetical protein